MKQYLSNLGIEELNAMQQAYLADSSPFSILLSNTGSGKTLAFVLKTLQILEQEKDQGTVLILSPTRELAKQIQQVIQNMRLPYSSLVCYGGHSFKNEQLQFTQQPRIIVATPGRILDHFQRGTPGLAAFSHLVIDEYDKTLALGFLSELSDIMKFSAAIRSVQLISATVIDRLPDFLEDHPYTTHRFLSENLPEITYYTVGATENDKLKALALLLVALGSEPALIFCTHREACERIAQHLSEYGKVTAVFHGGLEQDDRQLALFKFKSEAVDCLVCSDLASRGLDIPEIKHIIHYQFPHTLEDFTHRNGRTARMSASGKVYLVHSENEPLPEYTKVLPLQHFALPPEFTDYPEPQYITLFTNIGRKDKIRKTDLIGFLTKELHIGFENIGTIEIFDTFCYLAVKQDFFRKNASIFNESFKLKKNRFKIRPSR
ncbi:MAG: box helicase [Crocinitomicaceae bacterium]|jgi:ATP-independent RNA helicase DbpA|nr:box helicase [Crocinitomicaceae bacterium]